ncbi:sugar ABC transporter ATP-binding protein [Kibdelosporangium philippinense]|uniref:Sugar ABC transporter ATP-binding protein n=2 Tax=Kibdelosporangium philippinense TaxID=211113 RepID=A0ABS8Z6T7_9PSEU|nr:sugar ABC transporter ATP-binding protein [Kibdelosporangium philippinense]
MDGQLLEIRGVGKSFYGIPALVDVDLTLATGEVHGLVGENGAGKSTLMKILAGVRPRDTGEIHLDGSPTAFTHPAQAYAAGISTVFQEFNLLPERSVAENVFLGHEPRVRGLVSKKLMHSRTAELLASVGVSTIAPSTPVGALSVAEQQIVEIAKALRRQSRIIAMDEPTAALADHEVELLYQIIRTLTARGVAILYVSHRLREVFDLCDRITVLKDGKRVASRPAAELDEAEVVRLMVGRPLSTFYPPRAEGTDIQIEEVALKVSEGGNGDVDGITLTVHAGEIVALAGLQGSGRTEVLDAIAGNRPFTRGTMHVGRRQVRIASPRTAIGHGIAYLTEDREATGLALHQSVLDNTLAVVHATGARRSRAEALRLLAELELNARSPDQPAQYLSGGNQQKVLLAKWILCRPAIVLLDEPTRGIDVGAKQAVYALLRSLTQDGMAVLLASSELPEVIGMADRILVLRDGRLVTELPGGSSEEDVMRAAVA